MNNRQGTTGANAKSRPSERNDCAERAEERVEESFSYASFTTDRQELGNMADSHSETAAPLTFHYVCIDAPLASPYYDRYDK